MLILLLSIALWVLLFTWMGRTFKPWVVDLFCALILTVDAVISALQGHWGWAGYDTLVASYVWRLFWRRKPPSKRKVKKLVGAKARAVRDKLVASMPKLSPVGKLAPVGA